MTEYLKVIRTAFNSCIQRENIGTTVGIEAQTAGAYCKGPVSPDGGEDESCVADICGSQGESALHRSGTLIVSNGI